MDSKKEILEEKIKELKKQINISDNSAKKLIKKHNGDLVQCILDSYNFKENIINNDDKYNNLENNDPSKKCYELRKIMDEKDQIFTNVIEKSNKN